MRIVYLINGLNGGGAAFPMVQVIGLMRELGHEVRVAALLPQDRKAAARLDEAGIPYELLGESEHDYLGPALKLLRRLRSSRPDLLWTSLTRGTFYGQLAGRLLGIPVVSWQHSAYLKPGNRRLLRCTRGWSARWVADSVSVHDYAQAALGIAPAAIEVWPPFVADPASPAASRWDGRAPLRLGTLGRLHPSKQYGVLLRAFARALALQPVLVGRVELLIGGDGPEAAGLAALTRSLGLERSVRFVGFVERPAEFLAGLHGYLQTSLKEGFCIAAHEAMQAGLPVIATRVGELAHSVRPATTGWLCEVGDIEGLAQAIVALAADPARAAAMGSAAREWVLDRYGRARFRATGERLLRELETIAGSPPVPRTAGARAADAR